MQRRDPLAVIDPSAMRRALRRADDGKTLDATEAEILLSARGEDLDRLCAVAGRVRDAGLTAIGRPHTVTYSRKVFIPLTRLCRDRCHYCTFATTPGRLPAPYLSPDEVLEIARQGAADGCKEALFTLGDRPEDRWTQAREWLDELGFDSTLGYVRAMAIRVLEETGLLPHLNPGVMTWEDLQRLKPVAPSMGLMLETTADVPAHRREPRQGSRGPAPHDRGCRAQQHRVHDGRPGRDRRDEHRSGRVAVCVARAGQAVRPHPGGHRPELPGEAGHGHARQGRPRPRHLRRHCRRRSTGPRPAGASAGAAQPGRPRASAAACSGRASTTGAVSRRSRRTTSTRNAHGRTWPIWLGSVPSRVTS